MSFKKAIFKMNLPKELKEKNIALYTPKELRFVYSIFKLLEKQK